MAPPIRSFREMALVLIFAAGVPVAGAATLAAGSADVRPLDANVVIALTLASDSGQRVSGIQFDLVCPESVARLTAMQPGPAAVLAGKSVSYNRVEAGRYRAIVAGLNQNVIGNGEVVSAVFEITAAPPDGAQPIRIEGLVMSDPNGRAVTSSALPGELRVTGGVPPEEDHPRCGCIHSGSTGDTPPLHTAGALCVALFSVAVTRLIRRHGAARLH